MVTRLRYTGDAPTAFSEYRIGMLEHGDEFGVPNDQAESYTRRADIEVVSVEPDETDEAAAPEDSESLAEPVAEPPPAPEPDAPAEAPQTAPEPGATEDAEPEGSASS